MRYLREYELSWGSWRSYRHQTIPFPNKQWYHQGRTENFGGGKIKILCAFCVVYPRYRIYSIDLDIKICEIEFSGTRAEMIESNEKSSLIRYRIENRLYLDIKINSNRGANQHRPTNPSPLQPSLDTDDHPAPFSNLFLLLCNPLR